MTVRPRWKGPGSGRRTAVASVVAYEVDMPAPGIHRGLPSTGLSLVVPVGEPLRVARPGATPTPAWSGVAGLQDGPVEVHHALRQAGVQVTLTISGARALLGVPAAALAGELLTLEDLAPDLGGPVGSWLLTLPERLAGTHPSRWAPVVRHALREAAARSEAAPVRDEVHQALMGLGEGDRVQDVAREVGLSRRRLTDLVVAEAGVTPARFRQLARLDRARARLGRGESLAEVAVRSGYSDQAHFARQWRDLTGTTATQWLREEFPFVQDPGPCAG